MILIFGGTTEGRIVCGVLDESGKEYYYSTKGAFQELEMVHGKRVSGAMTHEVMHQFITEQEIQLVIDAAHPFAAVLHKTIGEVTAELGIPVIRYERRYSERTGQVIECASYEEMIAKLEAQPCHRLLALTGVNTIAPLKPFWSRHESYFRILDREDSREKAEAAGFPFDHIVYFQPGEDQELFDRIQPDAVITKESGESGFFDEKIAPALAAGVPVYMITRPALPEHYQYVYGPVGLRKAVQRLAPDFFPLKTGFTTGSTATAATMAALHALLHDGEALEQATIILPSGEEVELPVELVEPTERGYRARARKYSGDDPDVTHLAEIYSEVVLTEEHSGIRFLQGEGVGRVTLPGLGLEIGGPAINRVPRSMMEAVVRRAYPEGGVDITISIPTGRELAVKTFNPRLGILDGISIVGTSGVVKPFSSEAFIASIVRQVDVALALGADTVVALSGRIFGKPADEREAREMLAALSGRAHDVLTGIAWCKAGQEFSTVEKTRVFFAPLSEEAIARYVATGEPLGKAGAYAVQGRAAVFVERIEGSFSNVVGLPLHCTAELAKKAGVDLYDASRA